jgi:hypothetical protein
MEGKKNDRPTWINKVFDQFLSDFKTGTGPIVNPRDVNDDLEQVRIEGISSMYLLLAI